MTGYVVAIPARHDASRLPGKPLRLLGGEPLVLHVARRALEAGAAEVWVAVDDDRIATALQGSGVRIAMTAPEHVSGSDRLAECPTRHHPGARPPADPRGAGGRSGGSRPHHRPADARGGLTATSEAPRVRSPAPFSSPEQWRRWIVSIVDIGGLSVAVEDPSRAPVPWPRDAFAKDRSSLPAGNAWLRHIGIYAYRAGFLKQFSGLPRGQLEQTESLEQLRALEHGFRIAVGITPVPFPPGVDTEADLARAEQHLLAADR